jgi:hypothetical protein
MDTPIIPASPTTRRLTISGKYFARGSMGLYSGHYVYFPALLLTGKWLQSYGFMAGQRVTISCEAGRLIITPVAEEPNSK